MKQPVSVLLLHQKWCNTWPVNNTGCCVCVYTSGFGACRSESPRSPDFLLFFSAPDTPALLTRMCRAFSSSRIPLANSLTESREDTSTRRRWTSGFPVFSRISLRAAEPRAALRQARITRALRRARSRAMNFPIPGRDLVIMNTKYLNKQLSRQMPKFIRELCKQRSAERARWLRVCRRGSLGMTPC